MSEKISNIEKIEYVDYAYDLPVNSPNLHIHVVDQFTMEQKKNIREARYRDSNEELNEELFYDLMQFKILSLIPGTNENKKYENSYQGELIWDQEGLEDLKKYLEETNIGKEKDIEKIITFINPPKRIDYEKAEQLLGESPNIAVAAMTILERNYSNATLEQTEGFLFTKEEEVVFLTGRTMLVALNKAYENEYVTELIKNIDDVIVKFNHSLIKSVASRYKKVLDKKIEGSITFEDLLQQGKLGVIRALSTFDIDRKLRLSTHASWWIRQRVRRFVANNGNNIRHPVHLRDGVNRYLKAEEKLAQYFGEKPSFEETFDYCKKNNIRIPKKDTLEKALKQRTVISLDSFVAGGTEEDTRVLDFIEDKSVDITRGLVEDDRYKLIGRLFNEAFLSRRERRIIMLRFGIIPNAKTSDTDKDTHTLEEVAKIEGVTRERIRQIEKNVFRKLASAATRLGISKENITDFF